MNKAQNFAKVRSLYFLKVFEHSIECHNTLWNKKFVLHTVLQMNEAEVCKVLLSSIADIKGCILWDIMITIMITVLYLSLFLQKKCTVTLNIVKELK